MANLQPLLVPCKGAMADLHAVADPSDRQRLQIWWGTALLQAVPRDSKSPLLRLTACMLLNLHFPVGAVSRALNVYRATLRQWQQAFNAGKWDSVLTPFHGPGAPKKLRPDVEEFARVQYRDACAANDQRMPYGFSKELAERLRHYWPDQQICSEALRQLFRDEDARREAESGDTASEAADSQAGPRAPEAQGESQNPNDCQHGHRDASTAGDSLTDYTSSHCEPSEPSASTPLGR